nr:hypothetical protein [uncultured Desulfobacter sp.]
MVTMNENLIKYCEKYEEGINKGDSIIANKAHDKISTLLSGLTDDEKSIRLPHLCNHENEAVRLWSATYLLGLNEKLALATISSIINQESLLGLVAEIVLDQWKTGTLILSKE